MTSVLLPPHKARCPSYPACWSATPELSEVFEHRETAMSFARVLSWLCSHCSSDRPTPGVKSCNRTSCVSAIGKLSRFLARVIRIDIFDQVISSARAGEELWDLQNVPCFTRCHSVATACVHQTESATESSGRVGYFSRLA